MLDATRATDATDRRSESGGGLPLAAALLGFALAGFVDIVLLHQILQWHHFLSTLGGDLRWQVASDGWYHAVMYAVALAGLWTLWRARADLAARGAGRVVAAWGLIGLGGWYVIDVLLVHFLLDLHHVRMDVANPIAWDIGFVLVFGLGPVGIGLWLRRDRPHPPSDGGGRAARARAGGLAALTLANLVLATGFVALRPVPGDADTIIAFAPWVTEAEAIRLSLAAGGGLVWSDGAGVVIVADMPAGRVLDLYRRGAIFVGGGALPAGCMEWRDGGEA